MLGAMGCGWVRGGIPYAVLALFFVDSSTVGAQEANAWRGFFAAGEQARQAEDHVGYAEQMVQAVRALPAGQLNRPVIQYTPPVLPPCSGTRTRPSRGSNRLGRRTSNH